MKSEARIGARVKVLWFALILLWVGYEVLEFLRLRREHVQIFHSTAEMILVILLVLVFLVGVFVKNRGGSPGAR